MTAERRDQSASDEPDLLAEIEAVRDRCGTVEVSCRYRCHSGDTVAGEWQGVRLGDLLADADPRTTHVRAVSADGYHAPIPVADALDAVVATERLDADSAGLPRIVGDSLDGSQTVRDLDNVEPVALPADADPEPGYLTGRDATAGLESTGDR